MTASVLAVGTEITQGQIVNSNASFISKKIQALGLETKIHLTVPDDRSLILDGLDTVSQKSDILFVTGGLGPTTDDFTREVVAEWCQLKLIFDETSYAHIEQRLSSRGIPIRENQKQQCYFPENSRILFNSEGTAHAFFCTKGNKKIFVLPGPPREVQAVWSQIEILLQDFLKGIDPVLTKSWDCLGLGESEIAHLVENALKDFSILKGYRVHHPYTEVKLISRKSQIQEVQACVEILESVLKSYIITRDGEDLLEKIMPKLVLYPEVLIEDEACFSHLVKRFQKFFEKSEAPQLLQISNQVEAFEALGLKIQVSEDELSLKVRVQTSKNQLEKTFSYPYFSLKMKDRRGAFASESVLIALAEFLT